MKFPIINNPLNKVQKDEFLKYLELMPDFKQEKTQKFTTIALTLIASIVLGVLAINPTLSTIANLQKQLGDDKFVEQKLQEKINNLSILQEKYAAVQPDLDSINNAIPQTPEITTLLGQIQAVAKDSNLSIVSLQTFQVDVPPAIVSSGNYSSFDFSISVGGKYQDMLSFIQELSDIQRIIVIDNATFSKNVDDNNPGLNLAIKGTVYYKN